jgi:hypothetical protein
MWITMLETRVHVNEEVGQHSQNTRYYRHIISSLVKEMSALKKSKYSATDKHEPLLVMVSMWYFYCY